MLIGVRVLSEERQETAVS